LTVEYRIVDLPFALLTFATAKVQQKFGIYKKICTFGADFLDWIG